MCVHKKQKYVHHSLMRGVKKFTERFGTKVKYLAREFKIRIQMIKNGCDTVVI